MLPADVVSRQVTLLKHNRKPLRSARVIVYYEEAFVAIEDVRG